jgi:hypothetical protein
MPLTLVETPGAANANTYATLAEANAYNDSRLHVDDWTTATDEQKKAGLIDAARLIDASFVWTGTAADGVQSLTWPRTGMLTRNGFPIAATVIPQQLKDAQSELARQLVSADRTSDNDADKLGIAEVKAGPVDVTFRNKSTSGETIEERDANIIEAGPGFWWKSRAMPDAVVMLLVPSWFIRDLITRPLVFKASR